MAHGALNIDHSGATAGHVRCAALGANVKHQCGWVKGSRLEAGQAQMEAEGGLEIPFREPDKGAKESRQ